MSAASVHRITAANADLLARVAEDVFDEAIDAAHLQAFVADARHALFVAVADGVAIGQARGMIHLQPDKAPDLYVDNLGVTPAAQRHGVATQLLDALIEWGRTAGCKTVWVATETDNVQANPFYTARGFKRATVAYYEKSFA